MNGFDNIDATPVQQMEQAFALAAIASNWPSESESAIPGDSAPQNAGYSSLRPEPQLSFDDCARNFRLEDCEPQLRLEDCLPDFSIEDCAPPDSLANFVFEPVFEKLAHELPINNAVASRLHLVDAPETEVSNVANPLDASRHNERQNSSIEDVAPTVSAQKIIEFTSRRDRSEEPSINESSDRGQLADRFLDRYTSMLDYIDAELNQLAVQASGAARKGDLNTLSQCRHLTKEFSEMQTELATRASNIRSIFDGRNAA